MSNERPYHALSVIPDIDQQILKGIAAGKSLKKIADEYGVDDTAVLRRVQKYPEYKEMMRVGLELRAGLREQELESAQDNVSVTRADRLLAHTRWLLERVCSDVYGPKSHVTVEQVGDLADKLRRAKERVIPQDIVDAEVVHTQQLPPAISVMPETDSQPTDK